MRLPRLLAAVLAAVLGTPGADRLAFLRIRGGGGLTLAAGDRFDLSSILAGTRDDARILGVFNGLGDAEIIAYAGKPFDPLGETVLLTGDNVFRGVAFTFDSLGGAIVFTGRGTTTFGTEATAGAWEGLRPPAPAPELGLTEGERSAAAAAAVPLPAAAWLLLAGLGALGAARRGRRAPAAA